MCPTRQSICKMVYFKQIIFKPLYFDKTCQTDPDIIYARVAYNYLLIIYLCTSGKKKKKVKKKKKIRGLSRQSTPKNNCTASGNDFFMKNNSPIP